MTSESGSVVVLGGSGFVGSQLVRSFAERGYHVRSASRRSPAEPVHGERIETVRCDVRDEASVASALRGASIVVGSFVGDRATQVEGIANVLRALEVTGGRLLYLSTAEVYGNVSGELDESAPLLRQGWEYSDSKIEAEALCREAAGRGVKVTLFRPSIVYGPAAETWVVELGNKLVRGHWGTLGRFGEGTCNLIYVDDLIEALHAALRAPTEPGATFNLNGPDRVSWNEFFSLMNEALELPALRDWSRPEALLRASIGQFPRALNALLARVRSSGGSAGHKLQVASASERPGAAKRLMEALKATPRWQALTRVYPRQVVYLDAHARQQLGYQPQVNAREGIARAAAWYRAARAAS